MKLIPTSVNPVTITLYRGIPFDNTYSDHPLIDEIFTFVGFDATEYYPFQNYNKESFINMKINSTNYAFPRTTKTGTFNFAFGNGLVTSIVLELTDDEINANYMKVSGGSGTNAFAYYYFITSVTQKNESTYLLNLELDVLMTYQKEFLVNIASNPVMAERKHCRRILRKRVSSVTESKVNSICFNQETLFNKIKANVIKNKTQLEFKGYKDHMDYDMNSILSKTLWLYAIVGKGNGSDTFFDFYNENGVSYPYCIVCFPLNKELHINGQNLQHEVVVSSIYNINKLTELAEVQKIVISPFPPFADMTNITYQFLLTQPSFYINVSGYSGTGKYEFFTGNSTALKNTLVSLSYDSQYRGMFIIRDGYGGVYHYNELNSPFDVTLPSISDSIDKGELKLQISPFKELRMNSLYGGEQVIRTQYLFLSSMSIDNADWGKIIPCSIATSNAESNVYYDYVAVNDVRLDVYNKSGVSNNISYTFPTGSNAELLFNETAQNQYTNSKIISAITNGLKIIGGVAAITFVPSVAAKVGGGAAIASGIAGYVDTFTDWSAKLEDLKNTPNSYTFGGSSFSFDRAMANNEDNYYYNRLILLPYIITYGVTDIEYKMCNEFMYNYGYDYNCETYITYDLSENDDSVFTRQIFNYVKLKDDVTSKLMSNVNYASSTSLPLIVAKKINEILNAGIKFWNFFGMDLSSNSAGRTIMNNYYQKTNYCNAEIIYEHLQNVPHE